MVYSPMLHDDDLFLIFVSVASMQSDATAVSDNRPRLALEEVRWDS